jgi:hypothetical protein
MKEKILKMNFNYMLNLKFLTQTIEDLRQRTFLESRNKVTYL